MPALHRPRTARPTESKAQELARRYFVTLRDLPFLETLVARVPNPDLQQALSALCTDVSRLEGDTGLVYLSFDKRQLLLTAAGTAQ